MRAKGILATYIGKNVWTLLKWPSSYSKVGSSIAWSCSIASMHMTVPSQRKWDVQKTMMHIFILWWLQIFAYAVMSAGSAASGVTNLNRTGIHHSSLPNFCKPLHLFCDRVAVSIAFTFFTCFLLAISVVLDVLWLSTNWNSLAQPLQFYYCRMLLHAWIVTSISLDRSVVVDQDFLLFFFFQLFMLVINSSIYI